MAHSLEGYTTVTVTVRTGQTGKVWKLPEDLLTQLSPYVNNSLNKVSGVSATSCALVATGSNRFPFQSAARSALCSLYELGS